MTIFRLLLHTIQSEAFVKVFMPKPVITEWLLFTLLWSNKLHLLKNFSTIRFGHMYLWFLFPSLGFHSTFSMSFYFCVFLFLYLSWELYTIEKLFDNISNDQKVMKLDHSTTVSCQQLQTYHYLQNQTLCFNPHTMF